MNIEGVYARLSLSALQAAANHALSAMRSYNKPHRIDLGWLYERDIEGEVDERRWCRRIIAEATHTGAFPSHPAGWGPEVVMCLWPRHVAHVMAESLGYCTPTSAANIIADAKLGKPNWCEWLADMAMRRAASLKVPCGNEVVAWCTQAVVRWAVQNKTVSVWHRFSGTHLLPNEITPEIQAKVDEFRAQIKADEKLRGRDYNYQDIEIPAPGQRDDAIADLYLTMQIQKSGRRHTHKGYMAEYEMAAALVANAVAGKGEPALAGWF